MYAIRPRTVIDNLHELCVSPIYIVYGFFFDVFYIIGHKISLGSSMFLCQIVALSLYFQACFSYTYLYVFHVYIYIFAFFLSFFQKVLNFSLYDWRLFKLLNKNFFFASISALKADRLEHNLLWRCLCMTLMEVCK